MRIRKQPPTQLDNNNINTSINNVNGRSSDIFRVTAVNSESKLLALGQKQSRNSQDVYLGGANGDLDTLIYSNNTSTLSSSSSSSSSSKKGGTGYGVNWLNKLRRAKGFPSVLVDQPELGIERFLGCNQPEEEEEKEEKQKQKEEEEEEKQGENRGNNIDAGRNRTVPAIYGSRILINDNAEQQLLSCVKPNQGVDITINTASNSENIRHREVEELPGSSRNGCYQDLSSNKEDNNDHENTAAIQFYSTMFAELFCIEPCTSSEKGKLHRNAAHPHCHRHHRKQENPKNLSANGLIECEEIASYKEIPLHMLRCDKSGNVDILPVSQDTSFHQNALFYQGRMIIPKSPNHDPSDANICKNDGVDADNAGGDGQSGVSMGNEIFVIDTSLGGWKVEKLLTRNGNSWKIKDKRLSYNRGLLDCSMVVQKKKKRKQKTHFSNPRSLNKAQMEGILDTSCKEQDKDGGKSEIDNRTWSTAPQTQLRSRRKRRSNTLVEDGALQEISEDITTKDGSSEDNDKTTLASDHPANLPKEGLSHSIYQVFMQAGKAGLTAREAVSRILEQGLPGLHEGGVVPRVEVLKIVSNSPYFMPLEESKYILCSALVGDDENLLSGQKQGISSSEEKTKQNQANSSDNLKVAKHNGLSQYWAAIRRARTGKTCRKPPSISPYTLNKPTEIPNPQQGTNGLSQIKRLKFVKQDLTGLGNRCNRSDGKGWHCPLRAKIGYLLCDHHLGRLRARVKSHIKSKMFSMNRPLKDERKRILTGSWVVKKVVERTRIGRHIHSSNSIDKVPNTFQPVNDDMNDEHDMNFI